MSVVEFPSNKPEAEVTTISGITAHSVLNTALNSTSVEGKVLCLYYDKEGTQMYGTSGMANHEILWLIETFKMGFLSE